jgi:hypothetical protein
MYSTTAYLYQQIQKVLMIDTSGAYFTARYDPVYSKKLTINLGVDNVILFEFINQDQKPVNITGSEFTFRLINQAGTELMATKDLEILSANLGRAKVVLSAADTDLIDAQPASWSIERRSGNYRQAVYTGDDSVGRGQVDIIDSVLPEFVPSQDVTIPTIYGPDLYPQITTQNLSQSTAFTNTNYLPVVLPIRYSSEINTEGRDHHTFRLKMDHYTGNVIAQAASDYQGVWAPVSPNYAYYNESETQVINVAGYFPLMRLAFNDWGGVANSQRATASAVVTNGAVTSITVTSGGFGYIAPPQVVITGTGAGATAEATINNGIVVSIDVTAGGSGFTQVPPNNVGAIVEITTGEITEITYR